MLITATEKTRDAQGAFGMSGIGLGAWLSDGSVSMKLARSANASAGVGVLATVYGPALARDAFVQTQARPRSYVAQNPALVHVVTPGPHPWRVPV